MTAQSRTTTEDIRRVDLIEAMATRVDPRFTLHARAQRRLQARLERRLAKQQRKGGQQ